jgi:hypothetical protein
MRTLLLALMIALLPLRGWVGDVMAVELAQPSQGAPHHAMLAGASTMADCHEDHAGHAPTVGLQAHAQPGDEHAAGACGSCTVCQICHSVALANVLPPLPAGSLPMAAPRSSQPQYASAERVQGDKPPIS